jgi:predicted transcriptional regulator
MRFPEVAEIKRLRKLLDLTQSELASRSGVSQSTIAKIEKGSINGSYEAVAKIFMVLNDEMKKSGKNVRASEVASKNVITVQASDSVRRASELMRESGFSQLPVFEGAQPVGSISEYGILQMVREGTSLEELGERTVGSIMDDFFPVLSERTPLEVVTCALSSNHAVLIAKAGKISGIITSSDLLRLL